LQHCLSAEEVLDATPVVLPTPQNMSWVGKTEKSAVVHEVLVALGAAAEDMRDILERWRSGLQVGILEWWLGRWCIQDVGRLTLGMVVGIVVV